VVEIRTLWVGGPPGKTYINIRRNLSNYGIDLVEQWLPIPATLKKTKLPQDVDLVIINHEMISHSLMDKVKLLAKREDKMFVTASMNTSKTVRELMEKNIISGIAKDSSFQDNSLQLKELPVTKAYMDRLAEAIGKFAGRTENVDNLMYFFQPEWTQKTEKLFGLLESRPRVTEPTLMEDLKSLARRPTWNLSEWRTEIGLNYYSALRHLMLLALDGYVERVEPYIGAQQRKGEPTISFNVQLTDAGRQKIAEFISPSSGAAVVPQSAKTENKFLPAGLATPHVEASITTATVDGNLTTAIKMLREIAQEDRGIISIHLDVKTGDVEISRSASVSFRV
jgi:hypothetical protein